MGAATEAAVRATATGRDLAGRLKGRVRGEVRADRVSRMLWSTDASIYQIVPQAVLLAADEDDVAAGVAAAAEVGSSVTLRGAGSSLAGQAVGPGLIIDVSRLDRIMELDVERRVARVGPGVVQSHLDGAAQRHGLVFGPDTSTANWATLGGMIANNAAGMRSIVYGLTADRVRSLRCLLADGSEVTLGPVAVDEARRRAARPGLAGRLHRRVLELRERHAGEVAARFPALRRRVSGYDLPAISASDGPLELARLICGSEGTLAAVLEAEMALDPRPPVRGMAVVPLAHLDEAGEATTDLLGLGPSAVELFDRFALARARASPAFGSLRWLDGDPAALLMVEFSGEDDEVQDGLAALVGRRPATVLGPEERASAIALRRAVLPLLLGVAGDARPAAFVEDAAVHPSRVGELLAALSRILAAEGTTAAVYGHASVGCLHARPVIDLKDADGVRRMRRIARQVHEVVVELGGSLSGEHGDGLARSEFLPLMYGDELVGAFARLKDGFDPDGVMNPGKIVDPEPMDRHLRYGAGHRARLRPLERPGGLSFSAEGGLARAVELCNGAAVCRTRTTGTMCPPFMVTGDEADTTRARANALRSVLDGSLELTDLTHDRLAATMDLCVGCKACATECPSGVDMAALKSEYLARRHELTGVPLRTRLLAEAPLLMAAARRLPATGAINALGATRAARRIAARVGIDRRRRLPRLAPVGLRAAFAEWSATAPSPPANAVRVALFADTFTEHQHPEIGIDAARVLAAAGAAVTIAPNVCCGRTYLSNGMVERARRLAAANVARLSGPARSGVALAGLEPSCILTVRDDYRRLLAGDPRVAVVARAARLFEDVLVGLPRRPPLDGPGGRALLHGHCHQRALVGTGATVAALRLVPGTTVEEPDAGCCGMAGGFGYEAEHFDLSLRIGERRLLPAVRAGAAGGAAIIAPGVSCREQIRDGAGRPALHPAQFLAARLAPR